ncbi:protein anon-73B1 [Penaeus vannamei]|uniref:protein anon-73B1 n=1 Tax=Penaeus vannamei TaxID=6689 RepID=UPI000F664B47|nr:protein anon-73B1-like [Penaeus vannamei]XP_042873434.1 protein anon-73B1-like [Penaeus japonicus]
MAIDPSLTETDIFDEVLKYGLFLGAIFQLVCIGAVIFVPSRDDKRDGDSSDDDGSDHGSPHTSPPHRGHNQHHRRKQDKKKRR